MQETLTATTTAVTKAGDRVLFAYQYGARGASYDPSTATLYVGGVALPIVFSVSFDQDGARVRPGAGYEIPAGSLSLTVATTPKVASAETITIGSVTDTVGGWLGGSVNLQPFVKLDIWPGFNGAASGGDWDATTYANWIAGIDANLAPELSSGVITKTDRGVCSDGVKHIYSYTAGSGLLKVLLNAGTHGEETIGQFAAMRWFEQFVRSTNPSMEYLRRVLKVVWVPTLSPYAYRNGRKNANDVDPNRNADFYWTRFSPPDSSYNKGSAAFSEPEPQVVKAIIDEGAIVFIDCHCMGVNQPVQTMQFGPPSGWALGKRNLAYSAVQIWSDVYGGTYATQEGSKDFTPTMCSWSSFYNLWVKNKPNAASILFETSTNLLGSVPDLNMSRAAAQVYCGMITTFLQTWLTHGQSAPSAYPLNWSCRRSTTADTTSIASAGTLIDVTTWANLTFDNFAPTAGNASRNYLDVLYPCPGIIEIYADGYMEGGGTTGARVDARISLDGTGQDDSLVSVQVPASASQRVAFACSWRMNAATIDGAYIPRLGLQFQRVGAGDNAKLKRVRMFARFTPNSDLAPVPNTN